MKNEVKALLTALGDNMGTGGQESIEQLINILDLSDSEFLKVYPQFKQTITEVFHSENFQQEILEQMEVSPEEDLEKDKKVFEEFFAVIDSDDELIEPKKEMMHIIFGTTLDAIEELQRTRRRHVKVKIKKLNEKAIIPTYAHEGDAGADIYALQDTTIMGGETRVIGTGLAVEVPRGYMLNIYPRSGVSLKTPLRVANGVGCVDENYRGEVGVILHNTSLENYDIKAGDRIAQAILLPVPKIMWEEVEEINDTDRGTDGFGSTDEK
ncbi:MAG: dUTP diphosphatase [Prevotella sp.]|nr:dUTP diphosphatase [Prevotella sp.]